MNEHYAAVLADLRNRREKLESELKDVDAAIGVVERLTGEGQLRWSVSPSVSPSHPPVQPGNRYRNMSVRWGVLWHLAEFSQGYEKTGEIAKALVAGGYRTEAKEFSNMVSAVLSSMKTKGEVETNEVGGYHLTDDGRRTWSLIKQGAKFRASISSSEQSLLSVQ